ncbi:MAG: AmiS/UreI family transporter, partial [Gaiellaceae bacterium]
PVLAGGDVPATRRAAEDHPAFITNHEIAILNVFTGFVGLLAAVTLAIHGNANGDNAEIRAAAYIMLFAFTYLWVAYNQFTDVNGHAFGWYCLFVAITAVVAGIYAFSNADGNDATVYLGFDWIAWAILWFMFFVLLALERPIARITGYVAILEGIGTSWVFALLLLQDELSF